MNGPARSRVQIRHSPGKAGGARCGRVWGEESPSAVMASVALELRVTGSLELDIVRRVMAVAKRSGARFGRQVALLLSPESS